MPRERTTSASENLLHNGSFSLKITSWNHLEQHEQDYTDRHFSFELAFHSREPEFVVEITKRSKAPYKLRMKLNSFVIPTLWLL